MRIERRRLLGLAVWLAVLVGSASTLRCGSPRRLTSQVEGPRSLPPLVATIAVSSYRENFLPNETFAYSYPSTTYSWCSKTSALPQNITINLTEPVLLYGLLSGGYGDGSSRIEYVNAFSLKYSEEDNSNVIVDHLPKVFNITSSAKVAAVLLPEPILAKTLYFHVLNYTRRPCWTLALLGCTLSEGAHYTSPSPISDYVDYAHSSSDIANDDSYPCTISSGPSLPTPSPEVSGEQRSESKGESSSSEAVGLAVSTAVVTVVLVALMVGTGVALCWAISRGYIFADRKNSMQSMQRTQGTLRSVENELYTLPERGSGPGSPRIRESSSNGEGLLSSDDANEASTVFTGSLHQSPVYELVQERGVDSLVDNAAYLPIKVDRTHNLSGAGYEPVLPPPHDSTESNDNQQMPSGGGNCRYS